ncbi:hypothetical protein [Flavobacterium sp. YO12]|uniref:hypothetical protein n=1 Tax=Flavobacterium sp. YO12 TaxID=1920029 RepID=UPI00100AE040|nr:hypothetical protein [Flavobacterium sp. YO12]RXM43918.1 hypothetical protein BOW55_18415 [Flavobacterium sp. YO12]
MFSQEIKNEHNSNFFIGYIYSNTDCLPIEKANIRISAKNKLSYSTTDRDGKFELSSNYGNAVDFIEVSSMGFKKVIKSTISDTIYLENETNQLSEIIINSKPHVKQQLSFFEKLNTFEVNFSWDSKAAVYIPRNNENKEIKNLLFAVSDYGGVKNLKFLPFKVNLYTVDSLGRPYKPILDKDIPVIKQNNDDLTKVDISKYKITIPNSGIFVAFIILEEKEYSTHFIYSKRGLISAVPALKAYKYNDAYIRKSYLFNKCDYPEKCNIWLPQNRHYLIDVEF